MKDDIFNMNIPMYGRSDSSITRPYELFSLPEFNANNGSKSRIESNEEILRKLNREIEQMHKLLDEMHPEKIGTKLTVAEKLRDILNNPNWVTIRKEDE